MARKKRKITQPLRETDANEDDVASGEDLHKKASIETAVRELFRSCRQESSEQMLRKKRQITKPLRETDANEDDVASGQDLHKKASGHPRCTSAEDCIGTHFEPLVQHVDGSKPGDIYCRACWHGFLKNPSLSQNLPRLQCVPYS